MTLLSSAPVHASHSPSPSEVGLQRLTSDAPDTDCSISILDSKVGLDSGASQKSLAEEHRRLADRAPWIRAALLGAQDGLVSVSSLMIGVDAISSSSSSMIVSGLAGLVAGSCSMAIGEFVSVHSQKDIELAALKRHKEAMQRGPEAVAGELDHLTQAYIEKGLSVPLARQVAQELFAQDPVGSQVREEFGVDEDDLPNPYQAATASAISFIIGATVPLLSAAFITTSWVRSLVVVLVSALMFVVFGFFGAWLGGAPKKKAAIRTLVGGLVAIGITYGVLRAFGALGLQAAVF